MLNIFHGSFPIHKLDGFNYLSIRVDPRQKTKLGILPTTAEEETFLYFGNFPKKWDIYSNKHSKCAVQITFPFEFHVWFTYEQLQYPNTKLMSFSLQQTSKTCTDSCLHSKYIGST